MYGRVRAQNIPSGSGYRCCLELLELVVVVYLVDVKTEFGACKKFFYSLVAEVLLLNLMDNVNLEFSSIILFMVLIPAAL